MTEKRIQGTLFDNDMVRSALKSLTPEQLDDYKKMGEEMYGTIDFNESKIMNEIEPPVADSISYIESGLKSGLLPEDMEDDEIEAMIKTFGDDWYKRYGFTDEDKPSYQKKRVNVGLVKPKK